MKALGFAKHALRTIGVAASAAGTLEVVALAAERLQIQRVIRAATQPRHLVIGFEVICFAMATTDRTTRPVSLNKLLPLFAAHGFARLALRSRVEVLQLNPAPDSN